MSEDAPTGELFSRVYLERGKAQTDSKRFRARLGSFLKGISFTDYQAARTIAQELGAVVPIHGSYTNTVIRFDQFIATADRRDLLDTITIIYRSTIDRDRQKYLEFVARAMREENLSYRLDGEGGVHFYVDEEFERSRASTLSGLEGAQCAAAREAFEDAHRALLAADPLSAVRRSFDAVENVFKVRFSVPRLGASEIKGNLTPYLSTIYSGRVADAAGRLAASFAEWTNAGHQFRHAPGEADPSPPPMDMAISMVAGAANYLRWLVSLP